MARNPYLNRSMIRSVPEFVGRQREVERLMARLGADPPQSVSVVGERRTGKSSLLWHVAQPEVHARYLDEPGAYRFAYLDFQGCRHLDLEGLAAALVQAVAGAGQGLPPLPAPPGLEGLHAAAAALAGRRQRLVLLLDEFESVTGDPARGSALFGLLRSLANAHPVAYVTASGRDLQALCQAREISESPFFNIFAQLRLGPLTETEAYELAAGPSARAGLPLAPHWARLRDLGGRLPLFLQIACAAAFECLREGSEARLDPALLEARFLEEATSHLAYAWARLSPPEAGALTALAAGGAEAEGDAAQAAALAALERRGYAERRDGGWRAFSSALGAFLAEQGMGAGRAAAPAAGARPPAAPEAVEPVRAGDNPFPALVGQSLAMRRVFSLMQRAAAAEATVLIVGETGTGKEVVARGIHEGSARAGRPFVAVNCGALAENLQESELFGHARGAFTGATADHRGLIESADTGTLFLDEVAETTPALQVKLLRVLEDGLVRPVGGSASRRVDVRLMCATNRDLAAEAAAGSFRTDLFYRLYVLVLALPPLRERREDIDLLVRHFLAGYPAGISAAGLARLRGYGWPGNVRELENQLAAARAMAGGAAIGPEHLWPHVRAAPGVPDGPGEGRGEAADAGLTLRAARDELERRLVAARLRQFGGNPEQAARSLGISRSRLYELARKHGIAPG